LLGARPGQGKTLLGLSLAAAAGRVARKGFFFTLDYTVRDVTDRLAHLGADATALHLDTSDGICADYVMTQVSQTHAAVAVIDYMQLLDQKRSHPSLQSQVATLRTFAKQSGAIFVLISQIDRRFDLRDDTVPGLADVRLPNPLDLALFDQACFLHDGQLAFRTPS
ncbi:MAG: DNA helicase, partial [Pseudomonadota bacterium]